MSQRPGFTKWLWCLFAVYVGPGWSRAISVRTPPKNPTTIEAQAKFFQYRHLPTHEDYEQGHRQGSERHFTERHERAKPSDGVFSAKVRWGDKHGGYGEHYWDLNHAGHAGNHGNDGYDSGSDDDGSYNHDLDHAHDDHDNHDAYDEPSEQLPTYGTEEYDPEQAAKYDESGRAKRAHPKIKSERKIVRAEENYEDEPEKKNHQIKERLQAAPTTQEYKVKKAKLTNEPPKRKRRQRRPENDQKDNKAEQQADSNQKEEHKKEPQYYVENKNDEQSKQEQPQYYVNEKNEEEVQQEQPQYYVKNKNEEQSHNNQQTQYYVKNKNEEQSQNNQQPQYYVKNRNEEHQQEQQPQYYVKRTENQYVPYEQGAGVRQHQHPEQTPAASAPRLFLEPTTGHVVDRATGQAYVLQPIAVNNYN